MCRMFPPGPSSWVLANTVSESLGNPTQVMATTACRSHYLDSVDKPFVRFFFWYRPLGKSHNLSLTGRDSPNSPDILQAQGIAPRLQGPPRQQLAIPGPSTDRRGAGKRPLEESTPNTSYPAAKKRRSDGIKVHIEHRESGEDPARRKEINEMRVWSQL